MQKMTPIDKEQRGVLVAALNASEHIHMNSFFEKCDEEKVTRSDWQATGPPYIPTRYAEIDAIIANKRTKTTVKNVESNASIYFPSDQFPLEMRFKMKLTKHRRRPPDKSKTWKSLQKSNEEALDNFNKQIQETYSDWAPEKQSENKQELDQKVSALRYALEQSAEAHIEKNPKKEHVHTGSEDLENLFENRQEHKEKGEYEEA